MIHSSILQFTQGKSKETLEDSLFLDCLGFRLVYDWLTMREISPSPFPWDWIASALPARLSQHCFPHVAGSLHQTQILHLHGVGE